MECRPSICEGDSESRERDDSKLILQTIAEKIDPGAGAENDVQVLKIYTKEGDKLVRVLSATELSAASFMHHIKMEAIDAGKPKIFKAVVWVDRIRSLFILYELRPIGDASGISGIKHQGYSSHEVSSSNPTASASPTRNSHLSSSPQHSSHETSSNPPAPASRTFKTSRYDESKMNSGFIKCWNAANSDQIRNYAQFAVKEYNYEQDVRLEFVRVLEASCRACGSTYRIKLDAMDDGKLGIYLVEVWLESWQNSIELTHLIFADNAS
ncbi:hypothetical protein F0562_031673 [Nyssa sinensis]|uniref:Cysteine proteinase inhibitor n=1 Tax=Nyssa sinensis TaxID=561372 RepID=A0A5J5AV19_9ASTE|nr:hypothetical protein F0562_031673 [Nyssa sinensis]